MDLRLRIEAYRDDPESPDYYVANGCHWDDPAAMLVEAESILNFCGCGLGTDFDYIMGGLAFINQDGDKAPKWPQERDAYDAWWFRRQDKEIAHFGNEAAAQFFYKWADQQGLAEHGGSVPGWLTEDGKKLLSLMRQADALRPQEEDEA